MPARRSARSAASGRTRRRHLRRVPHAEATLTRVSVRDGKLVQIPREQWKTLRLEDQCDAVLHLGAPSTLRVAPLSPAICADRDYVDTRLRRMAIAELPPSEPELKRLCAR